MKECFTDTNGRIDALTHMTMLLAQNAYNHEARIKALEGETP